MTAEGHATKPPARYTEASLVKDLERGIGRPSTYASIMGVLVDRGYVSKRGTALVPSWLAFAVVRLLEEHFSGLVDYDFTATMNDVLDTVASGDESRLQVLNDFYLGGSELVRDGFPASRRSSRTSATSMRARTRPSPSPTLNCAARWSLRAVPRQNGQMANVPEDLAPDELTPEKAEELLAQPSGDRELGVDPASGNMIVAKSGRYGPYVTEVLPEEEEAAAADPDAKPKKKTAKSKVKPRTASLFRTWIWTT